MNLYRRPLQGCTVGLSVSESGDSAALGFPSWRVNQMTVQMVSALFGQGAAIVFGHDWREDGVMEAIHGFAMRMQPVAVPAGHDAGAAPQPLLQNVLPWPDIPRLQDKDLERLGGTLQVESAGLPDDLKNDEAAFAGEDSRRTPRYAYFRSRALTHLRQVLEQKTRARISFGGRTGGSQGRYPGIIEEAFLAVRHRKPLYLCGILGGATKQVIDAIEGSKMPDDFCSPEKMRAVYREYGETDRDPASDLAVDPGFVWQTFNELRLDGLTELNRLSKEQNATLFQTQSLDQAIELILLGLGKLRTPA